MSFRTVIISKQAKISYKNKYMVVKNEDGEKYVHLSEIDTVIVDSIAVSITSYLLKELIENKINIIFCDEKHNPFGEMEPLYSAHNSSKKIMIQINWTQEEKDIMWKKICKNKIINQSFLLRKIKNDKSELLMEYSTEITNGDRTNREGHAAKVYFNALFGNDFNRNQNNDINKYLNYGYSILMSTISREIRAYGYLTELGIHHIGESNSFNLSCDLIEPFRPLIDSYVIQNKVNNDNFKDEFIKILSIEVQYNEKSLFLDNAIHLYVEDLLSYLQTGNLEKIRFVKYEL